ncbi:glycosyltransferase family 2 protein [Brumimicrobium oceani]|uniref:Glycosyltransferase 2-like domain-containing protein n=1 Tax=Brumimicrobium oceani TaxID=2100725 RepID=A0A2U2XGX8_9FLAO|nr:glycosyltransferase family A protein [Brumimicrobium oceani]PWH86971.1 hypothetical protein DIT68_01555 [Brumimicrobium oceani]
MFSVVIPLYNKEASITATIQSVLNQTFDDFEIVIVNDGSTDKSVEVVEGIKDPRIRLINQENQGVSAARNKGIAQAKNDWIAFLDGDDIWLPEKLMVLNEAIKKHPQVKWLIHAFDTVRNQENRTPNSYEQQDILKDVLFDLKNNLKIQTSAVTVHKSCFSGEDMTFRVGYNTSEDRELWYKLAFKFPSPFYSSKILSEYVIDSTGQSLTTNSDNSFNDIRKNINMEDRLEKQLKSLNSERQKAFYQVLNKINKKDILNFWCVNNKWSADFNRNFNRLETFLFKNTINLPILVKKVIKKLFFVAWSV